MYIFEIALRKVFHYLLFNGRNCEVSHYVFTIYKSFTSFYDENDGLADLVRHSTFNVYSHVILYVKMFIGKVENNLFSIP